MTALFFCQNILFKECRVWGGSRGMQSQLFASINTFSEIASPPLLAWWDIHVHVDVSTTPTPFYMLQNNFQSHILCHQRHLSFMRKMFGNFAEQTLPLSFPLPTTFPPPYPSNGPSQGKQTMCGTLTMWKCSCHKKHRQRVKT